MAREREEGLAAMQKGDLPTAAILLEQVVRQDKEDFEAHLYLGGVYHQMKRHGDAARVLTRATELQPESAQARFNLGIAREQSGDLNGAQTAYQQAILLQEDYPVAHEALERVEARLNGPSVLPETVEANSVETTLAEAELGTFAVEDKPAFTKPVRSSFGRRCARFQHVFRVHASRFTLHAGVYADFFRDFGVSCELCGGRTRRIIFVRANGRRGRQL